MPSLQAKARANQNLYIEEEQKTQWPKEKVQKDKQRSTKHTYKTEDQVTRTPQKNVGKQGHNSRTEQVAMSAIKLKIE